MWRHVEYEDGRCYDGMCKYFKSVVPACWLPHGHGVMRFPSGTTSCGEFKRGVLHGTGVFQMENGFKYEGEFIRGQVHGRGAGVCVHADGNSAGMEWDKEGNFVAFIVD